MDDNGHDFQPIFDDEYDEALMCEKCLACQCCDPTVCAEPCTGIPRVYKLNG
jgi:hypothetical protein